MSFFAGLALYLSVGSVGTAHCEAGARSDDGRAMALWGQRVCA